MTVFDTSPLIFLDLLGYTEIVARSYWPVVPPQVAAELSVKRDRPGGGLVERGLVRVSEPAPDRLEDVRDGLNAGNGEVAAIALALDLGVPVILDDTVPRRFARAAGLSVAGTLGVLIHLHRADEGLRSPEADIEALTRGGMWLTEAVVGAFKVKARP